ncbi:MAG TPA: multiprotein-bridging factor 1 family protein [Bacillales bacterium]|nr:multiprotein-bridging factor 1 family protein [Bacillales bacterium]
MVSFCELCGKQTAEVIKKIRVENSVFNVCIACSKRGKPIEFSTNNLRTASASSSIHGKSTKNPGSSTLQYSPKTSTTKQGSYSSRPRPMPRNRPPPQNKINLTDEMILNPEFPKVIREARSKKGMTHEQLGQKINEKVTLLKKIETGTIKPDDILSKKLERFLGVRLFINSNEEDSE